MNYGLYLSASGVLTNTYRQDVFANNLANVETPGFKPDIPAIRQRDPESVEDQLGMDVSKDLLDKLGGGVLAGRQRISFAQGAPRKTDNPLDVAITDKHQFLAVRVDNPKTGQAQVHLTRDGRLTVDSATHELTTQAGHPVLDNNDQPIIVEGEGPAAIDGSGQVLVGGVPVGQLQVAHVQALDTLTKRGQGLFAFSGTDPRTPTPAERVNLQPGYIETSAVDPIKAMMQVVAATKALTGNANMLRYHDMALDRAVNTLGRVA